MKNNVEKICQKNTNDTLDRPFTFKDLEEVIRKTIKKMEKPKPVIYAINVHIEEELEQVEKDIINRLISPSGKIHDCVHECTCGENRITDQAHETIQKA